MMIHVFFLVAVLAQVQPSPADKARAQAALVEGNQLYDAGKIDEALARFHDAYAAYPSPKILFNIGQANRDLGRPVEAIEAFQQFLSGAVDVDKDVRLEANRYVDELHNVVGWIEIVEAPDGADIIVAGKLRGRTPVYKPLPVEPGRHDVVVDTGNDRRHTSIVAPRPGQVVRVTVTSPAAYAARNAGGDGMLADNLRADATEKSVYQKGWFIVGAGVTGALAVGAMVAGLSARSRFNDLKGSCGQTIEGCSDSQIDSVGTRSTTANVLWALTGVAAATTGVMVYLDSQGPGVSLAMKY